MEYQKIINLLDNTPNLPAKFKTKNWVEINDQSCGTYIVNIQVKFKTSMLRSSLCDYSDAYILVSATITVPNTGTAANPSYKKNIIIKNCASFTNCISEINNTQIDPPGNKTLWRHRQDVSLYVPATLQVRPK